ncbi:MAG: tetratricopeptide repeat protein [Gemmatirosa sp.]|nr:tetratricopeptide repeat protein [Gemmatirosa sp.]
MTNPPNPPASKLDAFRAMVAKNPDNHLAHFGLANEAIKAGLHEEAVTSLRAYLAHHDDEGNGWGRLAESLAVLGRVGEARDALRRGIEASHRFGHPSMASEFEQRLEELDDA